MQTSFIISEPGVIKMLRKYTCLESLLDKGRVTKRFTVRSMKEKPVFLKSGESITMT